MSYLGKRFEAAVSVLVADGPIKQRLTAAYSEHLDDLESFLESLQLLRCVSHGSLGRLRYDNRSPLML